MKNLLTLGKHSIITIESQDHGYQGAKKMIAVYSHQIVSDDFPGGDSVAKIYYWSFWDEMIMHEKEKKQQEEEMNDDHNNSQTMFEPFAFDFCENATKNKNFSYEEVKKTMQPAFQRIFCNDGLKPNRQKKMTNEQAEQVMDVFYVDEVLKRSRHKKLCYIDVRDVDSLEINWASPFSPQNFTRVPRKYLDLVRQKRIPVFEDYFYEEWKHVDYQDQDFSTQIIDENDQVLEMYGQFIFISLSFLSFLNSKS